MRLPRSGPLAMAALLLLLLAGRTCAMQPAMQDFDEQQQEALCLARVGKLPRAEGYASLCRSVASLYQQEKRMMEGVQSFAEERKRLTEELEKRRGAEVAASNAKEEAASLRAQNAALTGELQRLRAEVAKLRSDAPVSEKEKRLRLSQQSSCLREERRDAEAVGTLGRRLNEAQGEASRLRAELHGRNEDVARLQAEAAAARTAAQAAAEAQRRGEAAVASEQHARKAERSRLLAQLQAVQDENARLSKQCG